MTIDKSLLATRSALLVGIACVSLSACGGAGDVSEGTGDPSTVFVTKTVQETVVQTVPSTVDSSEPTTSVPTATTPTSSGSGTSSSPLDLGTSADLDGTYSVTVQSVNENADQLIESTNEFNEPPKGRYVVVSIGVIYVGNEEGNPWLDLTIKYVGTDARQYDTTSCSAVVPQEASELPTLEHGGRAHYQVCFDMPAAAIANGKIFAEDSLSFDGQRLYWKTR